MRGWTVVKVFSKDSITFKVEVWEQPWWRYALAACYHWYDMRVHKVPGFKALEDFQARRARAGRVEDDFFHFPLSARQDERCYSLSHRGRQVLASLPVDSDSAVVKTAWPRS